MILSGKLFFADIFSHHAFPLWTAVNLAKTYIYIPEDLIWQVAFVLCNLLSLSLLDGKYFSVFFPSVILYVTETSIL